MRWRLLDRSESQPAEEWSGRARRRRSAHLADAVRAPRSGPPLAALGLVPVAVELLQRERVARRLDGPAPVPLDDPPLDMLEAPGELVDRPAQRPLRVDAGVARQVSEREEHVAELLLDRGGIAAIEGPIELSDLLVHLRA